MERERKPPIHISGHGISGIIGDSHYGTVNLFYSQPGRQ